MNRRIFVNLILYDIRKGFRENKIKWIVGVFIFVFFSFNFEGPNVVINPSIFTGKVDLNVFSCELV